MLVSGCACLQAFVFGQLVVCCSYSSTLNVAQGVTLLSSFDVQHES